MTQAKTDRRQQVIDAYRDTAKRLGRRPTLVDLAVTGGVTRATLRVFFPNLLSLENAVAAIEPGLIEPRQVVDVPGTVIEKYLTYLQKERRFPKHRDLVRLGVTREELRHHFGTLVDLKDVVRTKHPRAFVGLVDDVALTPDRMKTTHEEIAKYSRFVITTAVSGCRTHEGFSKSIETYCKANDALLLVMMATDPASHGEEDCLLDNHLANAHIVAEDVLLNDNLFLSAIKLSAKQLDPMTGLKRIGQRNGSFVYASPKQRMSLVATGTVGLPHAMMTTGAVTLPDYDPTREGDGFHGMYMSKRTAYIAENDHVMGAIIVEIADDEIFHYRQVQAQKSGAFIDLGMTYHPTGISRAKVEALVLGDWHSGETDLVAAGAFVFGKTSVASTLKPARIVIHDGFNGASISHHDKDNAVILARRAAKDQLSLAKEIRGYAEDLVKIAAFTDEVVLVQSNHDEFLHRYLKEGRFVDDPENIQLACHLLHDFIEGKDPLRNAIERTGLVDGAHLTWLSRDESYKVAGIELSAHGDKGANGSKGSMRGVEDAYGICIVGHAHTPEILRGVFRVGTCSFIRLDYTTGPSSWLHTSCIVYEDGSRQLINCINGEWCTLQPTAFRPIRLVKPTKPKRKVAA